MKNELNKIAKDTNIFLKKFIKKQKKTEFNSSNAIWIISWRKKN